MTSICLKPSPKDFCLRHNHLQLTSPTISNSDCNCLYCSQGCRNKPSISYSIAFLFTPGCHPQATIVVSNPRHSSCRIPNMAPPSTASAVPTELREQTTHRGSRRRGRGNGRTAAAQQTVQNGTASGRAFGGQLTRLHADAPAFVPASVFSETSSTVSTSSSRPGPKKDSHGNTHSHAPKPHPRAKRRLSRSVAPDISTRIHDDIAHGIYECAICTNEVSRNSKIWSCRTCWTVFHIGCIKKWSKNEGAGVAHNRNEEEPAARQWRCPGCNLPKDVLPSSYSCWCEKEIDPKILGGLPPHSCGQTCGRERVFPKKCPHPCDQICHAGPCPPCTHMGTLQSCFCGKEASTKKCTETNYEAGWSCNQACGDVMPCGEHSCTRPCHEGLCGACEEEVQATCYCGKVTKDAKCCDTGEEKDSYAWIGTFDCGEVCGTAMDCGEHHCETKCHPRTEETPHCPKSPDVVNTCPCGKTGLGTLGSPIRITCKDPIPNCDKRCEKSLDCGHLCPQICHSGECLPCFRTVQITCRCGRNTFDAMCYTGDVEPPQCLRTCKATLNCGRHECGDRCCTGERKSIERQATKRKLKPLGMAARIDEGIEAEHICTRTCGRLLKCGNHTCPDLCHKGPCNSCREAIFEDISCNCGRTTLQAPLPCGTQAPPCTFPCQRPKNCGHPQVAHSCHIEDDDCPKCPYLTEKSCLCGKKNLKNQPCWRSDVLCGLVCGKTLKCGSHTCQKTCHKPGQCEDALIHCKQQCGKAKKSCGHPCEKPCHAPSACKEDKNCPFKIMITCDCQRKKEEVRCNSRAAAPDAPGRHNALKCDEECARLERNRGLAAALHIPDDHLDEHVPYSTATLKMYLEDATWAHKQEEILRMFAVDVVEKRLRLPPMKRRQRGFIHSISEDFGFDSESLDPEPHRHVLVFKTPKFVAAPMKTLAQAARIKRAALAIAAPVAAVPERKADEVRNDYNGFLLSKPRFALTEEELRPILAKAAPTTLLDVVFLTTEDSIALLPSQSWETPEQLTTLLTSLQPTLAAEIEKHGMAASLLLCLFERTWTDVKIIHQQGKHESASTNGWSQVAARRSAPMTAPQVKPVGQRPVYTVLGSRLAEAKKQREAEVKRKKLEAENLADNWEDEVEEAVGEMVIDEDSRRGSVEDAVAAAQAA
jgi:transcriptional repressor NF-X1